MTIALGCDSRGYVAKQDVARLLSQLGHCTMDFGCDPGPNADYPNIALSLAISVASKQCELGILIGGDSIGLIIVANKLRDVRAASVSDALTCRCAREKYQCNIIGIGIDLIGTRELHEIVHAFLCTTFAAGRHVKHLERCGRSRKRRVPTTNYLMLIPTCRPRVLIESGAPTRDAPSAANAAMLIS